MGKLKRSESDQFVEKESGKMWSGKKKTSLSIILFCCLTVWGNSLSAGEGKIVWQLGKADGSYHDFKIYYHPWEYGSVRELIHHPAMDHRTLTFTYEIRENRRIENPDMPCGISTPYHVSNVGREETCSNLRIRWNEETDGFRQLLFRTADWDNWFNETNGIHVLLPGGGLFVAGLKNDRMSKSGNQSFSVRFPVVKGANVLEIRIVTNAKHYRLKFDYIQLSTAEKADRLPPVFIAQTDRFSAIAHPGDKMQLLIQGFNAADGKMPYRIEDYFGKEIEKGTVKFAGGRASISLPTVRKGWYRVRFEYGKSKSECSYVVLEPVKKEYVERSRFGCHAFAGDFAARIVDRTALAERKMRRAFLGGAKWARWHWVSWSLREPQKGNFCWDYLKEQLAIAEKYRIYPMLNVFMTPDWASSTPKDPEMLRSGCRKRNMVPPRDWNEWKRFLTALVKFCGPSVKLYELGNEPGYSSVYWHIGSVEKYAEFLKYGYAGVKEGNPDALVLPGAPLTAQFLEEVIRKNGGKAYFDILSVHYQMNQKRGSKVFAGFDAAVKRTLGHSVRTVNSEDMGWNYSPRMERAKVVPKLYVRDAASGIEKTFGFAMFENSPQPDGYWPFFTLKGFPNPEYAAYRTMTHHLEYADYAGNLSGADYEAYLFDRKGTPVLVLWTNGKCRVRLDLKSPHVHCFDLMDRGRELHSPDGTYELALSDAPVFLIGGDLTFLKSMVAVRQSLPHTILGSGKSPEMKTFALPSEFQLDKVTLPKGWSYRIAEGAVILTPDPRALNGVYACAWNISGKGYRFELPFLYELSEGGIGENLVRNGDFEKKFAFWWTSQKKKLSVVPGGMDGALCLKITGGLFWGQASGFAVRPGDRYLLSYDLKGEGGSLGVVYTIYDGKKKKLFPKREGINALSIKGSSGWKRYSEIIEIHENQAAEMKIALLANYRKTEKNATIWVDNVRVVRLTDKISPAKALYRGEFLLTEKPPKVDGDLREWTDVPAMILKEDVQVVRKTCKVWNGPQDLSAKMQVMMDSANLYLAVTVNDDQIALPEKSLEASWKTDSVQIGIDPYCEGREMHQLLLARDENGRLKVWKHRNFFTPEIPMDLTRLGELKDAEGVFRPVEGGAVYEVRIPLRQLYPLNVKMRQIGFSWLVNDNDGNGRKYIQWSAGIGEKQFADLYGLLVRKTGKKRK